MSDMSYLDEFKAIRMKYQTALTEMMACAVESVKVFSILRYRADLGYILWNV